MGLEAIALAVNIGATAHNVVQGNRANRARKESRQVSNASETLRNRNARRKKVKELRIRRAQIAQSSANSGTSGSSGELGAISSLNSGFGASVADQKQNSLAVQGINTQNQNVATAASNSRTAAAFSDLVKTSIELFED